ncbi:MAG TPA: hypothetical protein VNW30_12905 [Opitutaceae bacterium]|nr:hypothetical protein [Opitutaceae bacterium]
MTEKTGSARGTAIAAGEGEGFWAAVGGVAAGRSDAQLKPPSNTKKNAIAWGQRNAREKAVIELSTLLCASTSSSRNAPELLILNHGRMDARKSQTTMSKRQKTGFLNPNSSAA